MCGDSFHREMVNYRARQIKDFHTTITHIDNKTMCGCFTNKKEKKECGLSQHFCLWKSLFFLSRECHILCHQWYIKPYSLVLCVFAKE